MKKLLLITIAAVVMAAFFVIGHAVGIGSSLMNSMFTVNTIDNEMINLTTSFHAVRALDEGRIAEGKEFLNLRVDGSISTIGTLLEDCPNDETKAHALKALAAIARHRQDFPVERKATRDVQGYESVISHVDDTLTKALKEYPADHE